jgi:hypothetical protein
MTVAVKNEPTRISDWLLYEEDEVGAYSRDNGVVAASQTLACGAVVGVDTTGKYVAYDDVGPDGDVAVGILTAAVTTGVGETAKAVIIARHARVAFTNVVWAAGLSLAAKNAAIADLKAAGVLNVAAV